MIQGVNGTLHTMKDGQYACKQQWLAWMQRQQRHMPDKLSAKLNVKTNGRHIPLVSSYIAVE